MAEYPQIGVRVDPALLKVIDEWRRKQDDVPTRPEAIRRLVETALGLRAKEKPGLKAKG
jgi:metal-responsive CopG/Arc/MetJ family transcriptional regulator